MAINRSPRTFQAIGIWLVLSCSASAQFTPAPKPNPFPVGTSPVSVVVGNFSGNSVPGIAVANRADGTVTVLPGNGNGGFTVPGLTFAVGAYPTAMAAGDFNKDGKQDLVVATASSAGLNGSVTVLLSNGSGGFTLPGLVLPVGKNPDCVVVKDLDGDGYLDLAIANRDSNSVTVLMGNSAGGFTAATGSPFPVGNSPSSVAAGDFNGDGYLDLAVANELDNTVTVLLGTPTGSFKLATASPFAVGYNPYSVAVADFNGDGYLDFATANLSSGNVTVLLGNGTGGFTPAPASPSIQGTKPVSMVVGDFNGDYIPDLAIVDSGSNNLTVLLGTGTGGFKTGPGSPYPVGANPMSVAMGDFNADGVPDLVIANSSDDNVTLLLNTFTTTPVMVSAASYSAAGPVAPGSLVSIFGTDAAATNMPAAVAPTPCLQGIKVTLSDFSGVKSPLQLFYVAPAQSYPGPAQINALIPATAATGAASFTISLSTPASQDCADSQAGVAQKGSVTLAAVAPSLFSANGTGKGVAAAYVSDLVSGNSGLVFMCPPKQSCAANAIDVSAGGSILELYGTGIQNRAKLSDVTVTIGSQTLPVLYAGAAPGFPGEDQVNVALPASLAHSGTVYLTVSVAVATSNQVTLYIR